MIEVSESWVTTTFEDSVRANWLGARQARSRGQSYRKLGLSRDQVDIIRNCLKGKPIRELMQVAGRSNRTKFSGPSPQALERQDGWR